MADGCALPFANGSIDLSLSNAVIEHVGGAGRQRQFVAEQTRVATNWVITTPNRWFPIEAYTAVLLRHWSRQWRLRQRAFTRLLAKREFRRLLPPEAELHGRCWSPTFTALYSQANTAPGIGGDTKPPARARTFVAR